MSTMVIERAAAEMQRYERHQADLLTICNEHNDGTPLSEWARETLAISSQHTVDIAVLEERLKQLETDDTALGKELAQWKQNAQESLELANAHLQLQSAHNERMALIKHMTERLQLVTAQNQELTQKALADRERVTKEQAEEHKKLQQTVADTIAQCNQQVKQCIQEAGNATALAKRAQAESAAAHEQVTLSRQESAALQAQYQGAVARGNELEGRVAELEARPPQVIVYKKKGGCTIS